MADALHTMLGSVFNASQTGPSFGTFTLNQSTDKFVVIFQADEDATITRLGLKIGTITGTVTWRISLQGVDASGNEDGAVLGDEFGGIPIVPSPNGLRLAGRIDVAFLEISDAPNPSGEVRVL